MKWATSEDRPKQGQVLGALAVPSSASSWIELRNFVVAGASIFDFDTGLSLGNGAGEGAASRLFEDSSRSWENHVDRGYTFGRFGQAFD